MASIAMPHMELGALFDRLQLDNAHHPGESALDVSLRLYGEGFESFGHKASDWSVRRVHQVLNLLSDADVRSDIAQLHEYCQNLLGRSGSSVP